jgi:hypothetical protein
VVDTEQDAPLAGERSSPISPVGRRPAAPGRTDRRHRAP